MTLRFISIGLDYETYITRNNDLRYKFQLSTRFISNYFSREIRNYKYSTDGTYKMISIALMLDDTLPPSKIVPFDVLKVYISFNRERYEKIRETGECGYYLELLKLGFEKASKFKSIPLGVLLDLIEKFKTGGCKNEWLHKRKRFKEKDLEVSLTCEFTTDYFQLICTVKEISTKQELVKGVVIKTEPDEVLFEKMFKDILIDRENIIITDASDLPRIKIKTAEVFNGQLSYEIIGDEKIKQILQHR